MTSILRQAIGLGWEQADNLVRRRLLSVTALVIIAAVFSALGPIALKYAVEGLGPGMENALAPPGPTVLLLFYVLCLWLARCSGELRWYFFGTADQRLHRNISRHLFDHVLKLPMAFHLDRQTGALHQTLVQGIAGYNILLNHLIFTILPVLLEVVLISTVLAIFLSPAFIVILLLSVAGYVAVFSLGVAQITGPSRDVSSFQISAHAALTDSLLNSETVKYFTAEDRMNRHYDRRLARAERGWARFYTVKTWNGLLVAGVFALSLGAAVALAANQVRQGLITIGDFILINAYMLQIIRPMEQLGEAIKGIVHALGFIEKMLLLLDRKMEDFSLKKPVERSSAHVVPDDSEHQPDGGGEVVFDRVTFGYGADQPDLVLKDISFIIRPGKTTAIVGHSGAGKSSILRLLLRFFDPDHGDIRLNGMATRDIPLATLRRHIAVVPQDTVLFNNSVGYNIGFGRSGSTQAEIEQAARKAHIHDWIMALPDGYGTMVGERGVRLSGGEKQRVSLARAALKNPQVYVFDEATSSLDTNTERRVLGSLVNATRHATTLIITHRLSTVLHADEILLLDQGEIIERGTHGQLCRLDGAYATLWHGQRPERAAQELSRHA